MKFADNMAQFYAIYQIDLKKPASHELFNNPIAVFSIESDAKHMFKRYVDMYGRGLTFVLTSHENGKEDYSEVA